MVINERRRMNESNTMASLIADLSTVVTAVFGWIATICTTIVSQPLLLLTVGFLVLGGATEDTDSTTKDEETDR